MPADEATARSAREGRRRAARPRGEDARSVADALHELTARFRLVLENAADVIVQYDADGQVLWASPSLRSTFGYDDTAVVGTRLRFEHPEDAGDAEAHVREVMGAGLDVIDNSHRVVHADGSDRLATSRTRVVRDADGAVAYAVVTIRDVTEQVEAERALVASEAHFRMLADNATDVILHTESSSGLIDWASPSALAILGHRPDELVGTRVVGPDASGGPRPVPATGSVGRTRPAAWWDGTEARFRKADGTWLWMSDGGRAILAEDGTVVGGIDSLRDVSIEHEMREELGRQARRDALTGLPNRARPPRAARGGARPPAAGGHLDGRALPRPRPAQGPQRPARPPARRRRAGGGRPADQVGAARGRRRGTHRRRRVRRAAARRSPRRRTRGRSPTPSTSR